MKGFMKVFGGFLLAALAFSGAANLSHAQGGDNSGRFKTPAYSGADFSVTNSTATFAQAGAPAAPGTAVTPGNKASAIPPQQGNGTALTPGGTAISPGAPAINPGVNTAIVPPRTINPAFGATTNGIVPRGTGTIGQPGTTAIGQPGIVGLGQPGIANPGANSRSSGATNSANGFVVNPDGSVTAVGGSAATALSGTNFGRGLGTNMVRTNGLPRSP